MTKKCVGCGAILQSDNKDVIGYIPKEKEKDAIYCQRCFNLHNGLALFLFGSTD